MKEDFKKYLASARSFSERRFINQRRHAFFLYCLIGFLTMVCLGLTVALIGLTPLKTAVPFLVKVDQIGNTELVKQLTSQPAQYNDAFKKFFLARFVKRFEKFNRITNEEDNRLISYSANVPVYDAYVARFNSSSFKKKVQNFSATDGIAIKIKSVVLLNSNSALVRFDRLEKVKTRVKKTSAVASVKFEFVADIRDETFFLINPLGFAVIDYRTDEEVSNVE